MTLTRTAFVSARSRVHGHKISTGVATIYHGERFNGASHLAGTVLAGAGAIILIVVASALGDPWKIVSFSVYSATLVLLYAFSTLYHCLRGNAKALFRRLDHSAIYILIAGTYTPFALVTLRADWGWPLFGAAWGMAVVGVAQELWIRSVRRILSLTLYLLMGWMAVAVTLPLLAALGWTGFGWLVAGGVFYTGGIVFYVYDEQWKHAHGIWHLFVLAGSASHYGAILMFVAQPPIQGLTCDFAIDIAGIEGKRGIRFAVAFAPETQSPAKKPSGDFVSATDTM